MTASNRLPSFTCTMVWEGAAKVSLDPRDAGNWTSGKVGVGKLAGSVWGVSAQVAAQRSWKPGAVTQEQALELFVSNYWNPLGADALATGFDHVVTDGGYNSGVGRARKWLAATPSGPVADRIHAFSDLRLSFLEGIASLSWAMKGLSRRVAGVEAEGLQMAHDAQDVSAPPTITHETIKAKSDAFATQAGAASKRATAAGGAGAAGTAATQFQQGVDVPLWALALIAIIVLIVVGAQLWQAKIARDRAEALANLASALKSRPPAVPPQAPPQAPQTPSSAPSSSARSPSSSASSSATTSQGKAAAPPST